MRQGTGAGRNTMGRFASAVVVCLAARGASAGADVRFVRGDSNADGAVNISDPVSTLGFLFLGNPSALQCKDAADSNDDAKLNISDAVHTLGFLFLGTPAPPAPFGSSPTDCGVDPTGADILAAIGSRLALV